MRATIIKIYFYAFLLTLNNLIFFSVETKVVNKILVKVGNEIITSQDLQNEIITNLIIENKEMNQDNIDQIKGISIKNLINLKIKKIEINKYKIKDYNKKDLNDYLQNLALNKFDTDIKGLKNIFKTKKINYEAFIENIETEFLWNSLIYSLYKNQTNINMIDVENELNSHNLKINKTEYELSELKQQILNNKKQEKLNLFSRSHFSNLENSIQINFL